MKVIKRPPLLKLVCVCLFFVCHSIMANDAVDSGSVAPEANNSEKQLLVDIFPISCHFSGQFLQQKNTQGLDFPLQSSGDFFFSCDLGLVWNTIAPFEEALLYVNARMNYRAYDRDKIEPMSRAARYAMSKIFLRILKGDIDYFVDEFSVNLARDDSGIELKPESGLMKKGIERILIKKNDSAETGISLKITIEDTTGQDTQVIIDRITEYVIANKQTAYEECKVFYPNPLQWCSLLHSPDDNMHDSNPS